MGLNDVRTLLIDALTSDRYQHEYRVDLQSKNLLAVGAVDVAFVVTLLQRCRGSEYTCSPHHFDRKVQCHVFTPRVDGERWYVKAYFLAADAMFISVHR